MCVENENLEKIKEQNEKDIMQAVNIIKEFGPDIKMIKSMLLDHAKRIDEEVNERKVEDRKIRDNYLDRFTDIKGDIKDVRRDILKSFIGVALFFFTSIVGLILAKLGGLL